MGRILALVLAIGVFCIGCGPSTVPVNPSKPDNVTPIVERAPAEEIFRSLANAVEAKSISTTTELAEFVTTLMNNDDLTQSDAAKFDSAFPGSTTTARDLTSADVATLKGLK